MVEKVVRDRKDILELINNYKETRRTTIQQIEIGSGLATSSICRWNDSNPGIDKVLKVLDFFDLEMVVRTKHEELKDDDVSDIDILIQNSTLKILKSDITLSDKERLYRVLQAFL